MDRSEHAINPESSTTFQTRHAPRSLEFSTPRSQALHERTEVLLHPFRLHVRENAIHHIRSPVRGPEILEEPGEQGGIRFRAMAKEVDDSPRLRVAADAFLVELPGRLPEKLRQRQKIIAPEQEIRTAFAGFPAAAPVGRRLIARASPAFALCASARSARSPQRSAQTSLPCDLRPSFTSCACTSRALTPMAKLWRKVQSTMPGKLADFFSPCEETRAS
jgi:hypothetical protein